MLPCPTFPIDAPASPSLALREVLEMDRRTLARWRFYLASEIADTTEHGRDVHAAIWRLVELWQCMDANSLTRWEASGELVLPWAADESLTLDELIRGVRNLLVLRISAAEEVRRRRKAALMEVERQAAQLRIARSIGSVRRQREIAERLEQAEQAAINLGATDTERQERRAAGFGI